MDTCLLPKRITESDKKKRKEQEHVVILKAASKILLMTNFFHVTILKNQTVEF
jgi:hypothetical protein